MNKNQRKQLQDIQNSIGEILYQLQSIQDEEVDKLNNMPLECGEKYDKMEISIDALDNAISNLQDCFENIQLAIEQ